MYAIKAVALKTGLTTHTIRVWERRYEIIHPIRTETNRRLYSEEQVQKLLTLKKATTAGHSIGQLAKMPIEEVERLVGDHKFAFAPTNSPSFEHDAKAPDYFVNAAFEATEIFDNEVLDNILTQASVNFSQPVLIDQVIVPFLNLLGDKWFAGNVRIAQEHAASAVIRTFLGRLLSNMRILEQGGPTLITATVSGLYHEFGAMLVAISAASQGWRSSYLGPNLPVEEIVFSAVKMNARIVVISIIYPSDDDQVRDQLLQLRRLLPTDVTIFAGGRAVDSYKDTLQRIDATISSDMSQLREQLVQWRLNANSKL